MKLGRTLVNRDAVRLLFVCSRNQWRSPTAESIYSGQPLVTARSRGTSRGARKLVKSDDLQWADIVFAMEGKHKQRLLTEFPMETRDKQVHVLDIPDIYEFMDPELIVEITAVVDPLLANLLE